MSRNPTGGFRRLPRVADKMTPQLLQYVDRSLAAERAGDAFPALEWHRSVPMFEHSRHGHLLEVVAALGDDAPPWVWARWVHYQASRCEDGQAGEMTRALWLGLLETAHVDLMDECHAANSDPIRVSSRVMSESWLYQQAVAHETDVVPAFIDEFATGRLAENADLARRWSGARLTAYELGQSLPGARLQVREAGADGWVEVLDLGARSCVGSSGWVLGRLVPSGVDGATMFDVPPLPVPAELAWEVAAATATGTDWLDAVAAAQVGGIIDSQTFLREDYELATDVQGLDLLAHGTPVGDRARALEEQRRGRDEIRRAAFRVLRKAVEGDLPAEDQAYVAAAALNVRAAGDVRRLLVRPGCPEPWLAWAERAPEPGRRRLLELAQAAEGQSSTSWKRAG